MGRTPTPTSLKVLRGNPGKRRLETAGEPQVVVGLGEPPAHLCAVAKAYWFERGPQLVALGTLGESDRDLFALLCALHARVVWLAAKIEKLRQMKRPRDQDDRRRARLESESLRVGREFARVGAEFGIGAAARTKIRVQPDPGQGELPLGVTDEGGVAVSPLAKCIAGARGWGASA
jgi:phage terminase small subunit